MSSRSDFFFVDGTLWADAPSYVVRSADQELFESVLSGKLCFILAAHQMGKSSLMVRTAYRLRDKGIHSALINMSSIDRAEMDQWYVGLLTRIKDDLRLVIDVPAWWQKNKHLGAPQRFTQFLHNVALTQISGSIAIFVDEIDVALRLKFRDDFFAAVRAMYNARASDPAYNRLTFVLLGTATVTDLIQDRKRTPFNIGHAIDLQEFSRDDAQPLQEGLDRIYPYHGRAILDRIFYWTNGHPYLTQKLCLAAARTSMQVWDDAKVDKLVETTFFSEEDRKDTNLVFMEDRIRATPASERRRMLNLYSDVYREKSVLADDRSLTQSYLELIGLVRSIKGKLHVRNEVYRRVFDQRWIRANTLIDSRGRLIGIIVGLVAAIIAIFILLNSQILEAKPFIALEPAGATTVGPGETQVISARLEGVDLQITWTATCSQDKDCRVLRNSTGLNNFFTAPLTPGIVIIHATARDKYQREASTSLSFDVVPNRTITPTTTATITPTLSPSPTNTPTATGTITSTPSPSPSPTVSNTLTPSATAIPTNTPTATTSPRFCLAISNIRLRSAASNSSNVLLVLEASTTLTPISQVSGGNDGFWVQVREPNGQVGWVFASNPANGTPRVTCNFDISTLPGG